MSLDRFASGYNSPKKTPSYITEDEIERIQKETKRKDREYKRQKEKEDFIKQFMQLTHPASADPKLNFPLVAWGNTMRYDIPAHQKRDIINSMDYAIREIPLYDGVYRDIHSEQVVKGCELEVIRDDDTNLVVSPYYNESRGTLIDMMPVKEK
jgi:hypothetical protein